MKTNDSYRDIFRYLCEYKGYRFIDFVELEGEAENYYETHYFFLFEKNNEIHVVEHISGPFNPFEDIRFDYVAGEDIPYEEFELLFKKIFSSERTLQNFMKIKFIYPLGAYKSFKTFITTEPFWV